MSRDVEYPERPTSEQLVDLHVYVVPPDLWRDHLNSAINTIINDTVSAGFVRVLPETSIYTLREELEHQLGYDIIPREYVFLKSVGRCLTRIRPKQEFQLKAKNFLPPLAYVPEVFLLEANPEYLSSYPSSGAPSGRNSRLDTGPSDFNPHRPVPPIRHSQPGSVRHVNGSVGSTAGTQTGQSYRSVSPITMHDSISTHTKAEPLPSDSRFKPVDSQSITTINSASTQGWVEGPGNHRRIPPYVGPRHINQLTPVIGSEPPGAETARTSPVDYHSARKVPNNQVSLVPPPPVIVNAPLNSQVPSHSYPNSRNNTQHGNQPVPGSRMPETWATRVDPADRKTQTQEGLDGVALNSVRSEADHFTPRNPNTNPNSQTNRIYGSNIYNVASQTDLRDLNDALVKNYIDPQYGSYRPPQGRGPSDIMRPVQAGNTHSNNNRDINPHTKHSGASDMADNVDYNSPSQRHPSQHGSQPQSFASPRHSQIHYDDAGHITGHPQHPQNGPYTSQPNGFLNSPHNGHQQGPQGAPSQNQQYGQQPHGPSNNQQNGPYQQTEQQQQQQMQQQQQYQRNLDEGQGNGYEPPLSATPPNSAGQARVGMKKGSDGQDKSKYNNNASDDSGISEMDEVDRRQAQERLRPGNREPSMEIAVSPTERKGSPIRETSMEMADSPTERKGSADEENGVTSSNTPTHLEGSGSNDMPLETGRSSIGSAGSHQKERGSREGSNVGDVNQGKSPRTTDRRQDLLELEKRRQEVLEEEKRNRQEEEDRWKQLGGENGEGQKPDNNETIQEEEDPLDTLLQEPIDQDELKEKLQADLEEARLERRDIEKRREELVKRARSLQNKTQQRRAQARDLWKKRYFEEKKKTAPLEEQTNKMRQELEALHRKIMSQLEQSKGKEGISRKGEKPSPQSNLKIQATKLQHEIEDLQRRVENVKMKLTSEMKLRNQAETELRALRAELTQKKINMSLSRSKMTLQGDMAQGVPLTTR